MTQSRLKYLWLAAPALVLLASGCANRHSVTVGAVPTDYRTNNPIMIGEKEKTLDLPVGRADRGATQAQKETLAGFLDDYDRAAAPVLNIVTPAGSANAHAAAQAARGLAAVAKANGVPPGRIMMSSYSASSSEVSAPIRISFIGTFAHTRPCGQWSEDIAPAEQNRNYKNFGCSYQNNIAAQIANPNDLLGPRKQTSIDAEDRGEVIKDYRTKIRDFTEQEIN